MKLLERELRQSGNGAPLAYHHLHWTRADAPLLDLLGAVIDHNQALSIGGGSEIDNLVTACNKCNGRKSSATLDKWGQRPTDKPIKGKYGEPQNWDGLSATFVILAARDRAALTKSERDWLTALS
jgi:5-methylcytosine-specific restriction endonuclease McrA